MKKEHCVLILICCFLMAACGRLEDIPEDTVGVSRDGTEGDRRDPGRAAV